MDRLAKELEKVDLAGENGEIADLNVNLDGTSELDGSEQIELLDDALSAKSEDDRRGTRTPKYLFPYMVLIAPYLDDIEESAATSPRAQLERQSSSSSIRSATSTASRESRGVSRTSGLRESPASKTTEVTPVEEDPIERRAREREERTRQRQKYEIRGVSLFGNLY
jgi:hypothetical protein